ncbi:hypothetical protein D3C81_1449440 [compost metagenome]
MRATRERRPSKIPTREDPNHVLHPSPAPRRATASAAHRQHLRRASPHLRRTHGPRRAAGRSAPRTWHEAGRPRRHAVAELRPLLRIPLRRALGRRRAQSLQHSLVGRRDSLFAGGFRLQHAAGRRCLPAHGPKPGRRVQHPAPGDLLRRRRDPAGHAQLRGADRRA